jgi:short-subunit dehydrogenase
METKTVNTNKYALITGATSGFGFEFAKLFARDGYNLVLVARSSGALRKIAEDLSDTYQVNVRPLAEDLFKPEAAGRIYDQTKMWGIEVNVLVNDAGQGEYGEFTRYDFERDVDLIQLNITSVVGLTKFFLKDMISRNEGKILQVSSLLAKYPTPLMAVYAATKSFVLSFTEALINELKDTKITMTALLPGPGDTDFFHKAGAELSVTYKEADLSSPEEVAKDGYDALMKGESKIVSGAKNKVQAAMSNVLPDSALASSMRKQMNPSDKEHGREEITHPASPVRPIFGQMPEPLR